MVRVSGSASASLARRCSGWQRPCPEQTRPLGPSGHTRRSQAPPAYPSKHEHVPPRRLQVPALEHSATGWASSGAAPLGRPPDSARPDGHTRSEQSGFMPVATSVEAPNPASHAHTLLHASHVPRPEQKLRERHPSPTAELFSNAAAGAPDVRGVSGSAIRLADVGSCGTSRNVVRRAWLKAGVVPRVTPIFNSAQLAGNPHCALRPTVAGTAIDTVLPGVTRTPEPTVKTSFEPAKPVSCCTYVPSTHAAVKAVPVRVSVRCSRLEKKDTVVVWATPLRSLPAVAAAAPLVNPGSATSTVSPSPRSMDTYGWGEGG